MPVGAVQLNAVPDRPAVTLSLAPIGLGVHSVVGNTVTRHWTIDPGGVAPTGFVLEGVNVPVAPSAPANLLGLVNGSSLALA